MIEIIAVTYAHGEKLKCFINSIKAQSDDRWRLHVIHDGKSDDFYELKDELGREGYLGDKVILSATEERHNDWGHSLRDYGLKNPISDSEHVVITNGDNYYAPIWIEEVLNLATPSYARPGADFIYWDCVHSHRDLPSFDRRGGYGLLNSRPENGYIDMGSAAIRSEIAISVGFPFRNFDGDWSYFKSCLAYARAGRLPLVSKIPKILFVHN